MGPDSLASEFLKHCDEAVQAAFLDVLLLVELTESINKVKAWKSVKMLYVILRSMFYSGP